MRVAGQMCEHNAGYDKVDGMFSVLFIFESLRRI